MKWSIAAFAVAGLMALLRILAWMSLVQDMLFGLFVFSHISLGETCIILVGFL